MRLPWRSGEATLILASCFFQHLQPQASLLELRPAALSSRVPSRQVSTGSEDLEQELEGGGGGKDPS